MQPLEQGIQAAILMKDEDILFVMLGWMFLTKHVIGRHNQPLSLVCFSVMHIDVRIRACGNQFEFPEIHFHIICL
jgi:hypothetical protein